MAKIVKISEELCQRCQYGYKDSNTHYGCDYLGRRPKNAEKRMRILNPDGSLQYQSGYCDKFLPVNVESQFWFGRTFKTRKDD